jgi:hypothetical protein
MQRNNEAREKLPDPEGMDILQYRAVCATELSGCDCSAEVEIRRIEGEGKMTANILPTIFTIEIGGTPTLTFEVQNLREAHEVCHEQWLKDDLAEAKSDGVPLWDGKATLRARIALPDESAVFVEAKNNGQPSDGMMLVYLIELDDGATDEETVDPGAFPPTRT